MTELLRALGVLAEAPGPETDRLARLLGIPEPSASEWTDLFVLELVPYASVYLGESGMIGGEARDRVAGFWRALGIVPPAEPDHLASLLGLYATLCSTEPAEPDHARRTLLRTARSALLSEHLESWLPVYLDRVDELASASYRAWGRLLRAVLAGERAGLGLEHEVPLHLRVARRLEHPDEVGLDEFVRQLLAPVRSGLVLTRGDLARAALEVDVGLRLAERRVVLRALLEQDPEATLRWLAALAVERSRRATGFWRQRAAAAAALLDAVACQAEAFPGPPLTRWWFAGKSPRPVAGME